MNHFNCTKQLFFSWKSSCLCPFTDKHTHGQAEPGLARPACDEAASPGRARRLTQRRVGRVTPPRAARRGGPCGETGEWERIPPDPSPLLAPVLLLLAHGGGTGARDPSALTARRPARHPAHMAPPRAAHAPAPPPAPPPPRAANLRAPAPLAGRRGNGPGAGCSRVLRTPTGREKPALFASLWTLGSPRKRLSDAPNLVASPPVLRQPREMAN